METIVVNPMSLVSMTTYHSKNNPTNIGLSYGLLYALQEELTYKVTLTAPLGTHHQNAEQLVQRMVEYETLRLRKGKANMNYYEQYILVGWYVMGPQKQIDSKVNQELSKSCQERGAVYSLHNLVGKDESKQLLFRRDQPVQFRLEVDPLEKYCVDTLHMQGSKGESTLTKTLRKEKHLVGTYSEKLDKLNRCLRESKEDEGEKRRRIFELMEMYDRME